MIQPLVFTSKEFANKGLMCNSVLFFYVRRMSCNLGKLSDFRIFASLGKVQLHKTPVRAAEFSECPILFCDLYIFFATRYHCFEIYTKFAVILTGLWSKNSCGRVRKQERNARETFSTPMRRMKIRCRQGRG